PKNRIGNNGNECQEFATKDLRSAHQAGRIPIEQPFRWNRQVLLDILRSLANRYLAVRDNVHGKIKGNIEIDNSRMDVFVTLSSYWLALGKKETVQGIDVVVKQRVGLFYTIFRLFDLVFRNFLVLH
ncbi:12119_t:CDS:2, partial [Acaulospora morrowiae]